MARDYNADMRRKNRMKRKMKGYVHFAECVVLILVVSLGITKLIDRNKPKEEFVPVVEQTGVVSELLAPLPMEHAAASTKIFSQFGPVKQEGSYTFTPWNKDAIRQKQRGQVNLEYFADAAFLGDSLTTGFIDFDTNLSGALICAYRGIGPDSVVKRSTQKHSQRGEEIPLNVLNANKPAKLYVLLGSNSLTIQGNEKAFLSYYDKMIDELKRVIKPGGIIYIQSIPPVRPEVSSEKPGLQRDRIMSINEELAKLAAEKGCYYIDLWEVLADENGNLKEECAAPDGIHLTAGAGYGAWVDHLRKHTVYSSTNPWTPGTEFYIDPKAE